MLCLQRCETTWTKKIEDSNSRNKCIARKNVAMQNGRSPVGAMFNELLSYGRVSISARVWLNRVVKGN